MARRRESRASTTTIDAATLRNLRRLCQEVWNRRRDLLKILWRDATGWCLLCKRLDERRVALPRNVPTGAQSVTVESSTLAALLDGVARAHGETHRDVVRDARRAAERVQISATHTQPTTSDSRSSRRA